MSGAQVHRAAAERHTVKQELPLRPALYQQHTDGDRAETLAPVDPQVGEVQLIVEDHEAGGMGQVAAARTSTRVVATAVKSCSWVATRETSKREVSA